VRSLPMAPPYRHLEKKGINSNKNAAI
jgi:hypothetical protein